MDTSPQPDVQTTPTTPSTAEVQASKLDIDAEYATKPHGGSKTPWIILGLAIALLVVFAIIIVTYFLFFNPPAMHEIAVTNNCPETINVLFGVVTPNQDIDFFPIIGLSTGQVHYYKATPGTSIIVQGYRNGDTFLTSGLNPFTTVELSLAGEGFGGTHQVTNGEMILTNVKTNKNNSDKYGVSVQGGYNIPISIVSTASNNRDSSNKFSCLGPTWNQIITGTGPNLCPISLQSPGTGSDYQVCLNPCTAIGTSGFCCTATGACSATGGCEASWTPHDYYTVFSRVCPNCMITNCDGPNYTCGSSGGLSQYVITYCPTLS